MIKFKIRTDFENYIHDICIGFNDEGEVSADGQEELKRLAEQIFNKEETFKETINE